MFHNIRVVFTLRGWELRPPPKKGHGGARTLHHHTQREDASVATLGNPKSSK